MCWDKHVKCSVKKWELISFYTESFCKVVVEEGKCEATMKQTDHGLRGEVCSTFVASLQLTQDV